VKFHFALALVVAGAFAARAPGGEKYAGAWWSGVEYREGPFEPGDTLSGRPPLTKHAAWRSEETREGTLIRVGKGYLTADEKGAVGASPKAAPGSYRAMKEVKTGGGRYDGKEDWKGSRGRTSYALGPAAKGLKGGKPGLRGGQLTVHPENEGLAILSATLIDAEEVSGK